MTACACAVFGLAVGRVSTGRARPQSALYACSPDCRDGSCGADLLLAAAAAAAEVVLVATAGGSWGCDGAAGRSRNGGAAGSDPDPARERGSGSARVAGAPGKIAGRVAERASARCGRGRSDGAAGLGSARQQLHPSRPASSFVALVSDERCAPTRPRRRLAAKSLVPGQRPLSGVPARRAQHRGGERADCVYNGRV